jgi:hypothetical protein
VDLELIWNAFLKKLAQQSSIGSVNKHIYSGTPFLYITVCKTTEYELEHILKTASAEVMKGKRLHAETIFVRKEQNLYVYRHRFFVPQEKMFCCGNICVDCIRLKK